MKWRQWILTALMIISGFPSLSTSLEGAAQDILDKITRRAKESQSDVILIVHAETPLFTYGGDKRYEPIETRSITKSFVALAIGILLQECKMSSIDVPVYYYFPEWNQGIKKEITVRHLLSNTSGLMTDNSCFEVYQAPDTVKLALAADLATYPGTHFVYNNKAVNLLAGIVEKASGMPLQDYLRQRLFLPLGIVSDTWLCDPAGNNYGMSHLTLNAVDLSKIGFLLANQGFWNGKRLLSQEWIKEISQPSQGYNPFYGLLWWIDYYSLDFYWDQALLDLYTQSGISPPFVSLLEQMNGRVLSLMGQVNYGNFYQECTSQLAPFFGGIQPAYQFLCEVESKGLPFAKWNQGLLKSYSARGFLGQQLIIFPEEQIIAVRLARSCGQSGEKIDTFAEFEFLVSELVNVIGPPSRACRPLTTP